MKGKLVKKNNNKLMKNLEIIAYPWLELKEDNILTTDNSLNSIIIQKTHDPKELEKKVRQASEFKTRFKYGEELLFPEDFTKNLKKNTEAVLQEQEANQDSLSSFEIKESTSDNSPFLSEENTENLNLSVYENKNEIFETPKNNLPDANIMSIEEERKIHFEKAYEEGFALGKNEGHHSGYLEGFSTGEQKGISEQQIKYQTVFSNLSGIIEQIEFLKQNLYQESRNVFIEILKICAEKVLRQQLKFSDSSLNQLFDQVLQSLSSSSLMTVELNPEDSKRLTTALKERGLQDRVILQPDEKRAIGDFKVSSEGGISILNLTKSVEIFLETWKESVLQDEHDVSERKAV